MEKTVYHSLDRRFIFFERNFYMNKIKFRNFTIALSISLAFLLLYNISTFAYSCQTLRSDVIRLHILANSDSDEDQELKLAVRDAVLQQAENIFNGTVTPENAKEKIEPEIENLENIARQVIKENGYNYNVQVYLDEEYFTTRTYDNVTLPAGKYLALKIIIGDGNGKNWWCVMFPSLCLPAAEENSVEAVFNEYEADIVLNTDKYEVRFKLLEYFEKVKALINEN